MLTVNWAFTEYKSLHHTSILGVTEKRRGGRQYSNVTETGPQLGATLSQLNTIHTVTN